MKYQPEAQASELARNSFTRLHVGLVFDTNVALSN